MKHLRYSLLLLFLPLLFTLPVRAVSTLSMQQCVSALSEQHLSPSAPLTRESLALLLPDAEPTPQLPLSRAGFCDILDRWLLSQELVLPALHEAAASDLMETTPCRAAVEYILQSGVMGTDQQGRFRPQEVITNAEAAMAIGRMKALASPPCHGQPSSTLPSASPMDAEQLSDSCMLGHSNVVGFDMTMDTPMDIAAEVGVSARGFLFSSTLTYGRDGGTGSAMQSLQRRRYDVIYLMLGTNDMVAGCAAAGEFQENMENVIALVRSQQPRAELCLLSITPCGVDTPSYLEEVTCYNRVLKELSRKYNLSYLDIFTPLSSRSGGNLPCLARSDGYHYTSDGYSRILDILLSHPLRPLS